MTLPRYFASLLIPVLLCVLPTLAAADIVHMKDGRKIEGEVTEEGDKVHIRTRFGSVSFRRAQIARIEETPSLEERYGKRRATVDLNDPDALVALGDWCRDQKWEKKAREVYEEALTVDPGHAAAHRALGDELRDNRWVPAAEIRAEKLAGTKARRAEEARARQARWEAKKLERKIQRWFREVAIGSLKKSDTALAELKAYALETKNPGLAKQAVAVRDAYDAYWKKVRAYNARMEVHGTVSSLRRPIRSVSSSLGGGSSPVSIQLPELGVTSVRTTIWVPAGRGK